MSKKKTQIERAIDALQAEIAAETSAHRGRVAGLESAIGKLRQQQEARPPRRRKKIGLVTDATGTGR